MNVIRVVYRPRVTQVRVQLPPRRQLIVAARGTQGPPGPSGSLRVLTAGANLSGNRVVRLSGDQVVTVADSGTFGHAAGVLGITTGAAMTGAAVTVQTSGRMVEPTWSWSPGEAVFCGPAGAITQSVPGGGRWTRRIGIATAATVIEINLGGTEINKL